MKHFKLMALICAALLPLLLVTGCKTQEQIDQSAGESSGTQTVVIKQEPYSPVNQVTVSGSGKAVATPDLATIDFSVITEAKTAEGAEQSNSEKMTAVIEVLKSSGIEEQDIQSSGFYVNPVYDYSKDTAVITGYSVQNTVTVKVRAFDKLGAIITDAIAAGANSVSSMNYSLEDSAQYYQQALQAAIQDATGKIGAIAQASGIKVSAVPISITEQSQSATPMQAAEVRAESMASDDSVKVPTQPGEMEVTAQVQIVYAIEEAE
ncbi:MAG: SIMPL domain-containing protein [Bacillota bacterium]